MGLAAELAPYLDAHPGLSAVAMLKHGPVALLARAALADLASETIDVQYYIYEEDLAGTLLTVHLLEAADRGVRIRVLLDDNNLSGPDLALRLLDAHPLVEVRVFNTYRWRSRWLRPLELLLHFDRLQRRMHNKIFAVDGCCGIFGGRNIGSNYFDADERENFADFDVFVAGSLISAACRSFDDYWNHPLAVPAEALSARRMSADEVAVGMRRLRHRLQALQSLEERHDRARATLISMLEDPDRAMTWARAEFVVDPPSKLTDPDAPSPVLERLATLWDQAGSEALIESAYFVPGVEGAEFIERQVQEGVHTRILTNSLAANDVTAVHVGYARYRRRLLRAGIELFEYQRTATRESMDLRLTGGPSGASLHAKVAVFDRRITWVGSFNLDPRSARLNSELAIIIHDEGLARSSALLIERDLEPDRAWRVTMEPGALRQRLVWDGEKAGRPRRVWHEPDATVGQRLLVRLLSLWPGVERLL